MVLHVPENIALIIHLFSNQKHVQVDSKILPALKISITCYKSNISNNLIDKYEIASKHVKVNN